MQYTSLHNFFFTIVVAPCEEPYKEVPMAKTSKTTTRPLIDPTPTIFESTMPKNVHEAAERERRIGELLGEIATEEEALRVAVSKLEAASEKKTAPLRSELARHARELHDFLSKNRASLTRSGEMKTVLLERAGDVRWYETPNRVIFTKSVDAIIRSIRKMQMVKRFIRKKEEIDKKAMLQDPDTAKKIPGVQILSSEKFAIRPNGLASRLERDDQGQWSVVTDEKEPLN